jgi:hypothetical protein
LPKSRGPSRRPARRGADDLPAQDRKLLAHYREFDVFGVRQLSRQISPRTCQTTMKARMCTTMASSWRTGAVPGHGRDTEVAPLRYHHRARLT